MIRRKSAKGFTLVELLIALFVFSLLTAFAFRSINVLWLSSGSLQVEEAELQGLQKALSFLERDIRQAVSLELQTVSIDGGESADADSSVLLVTGLDEASSKIKQSGYYLKDEKLISGAYDPVDGLFGSDDSLVLLSDITSFEVALKDNERVPSVLQLALSHKTLGLISRNYYIGISTVSGMDLNVLDTELGTSAGGSQGEVSTGISNAQANQSTTQPAVGDPLQGQAIW